ncbi:7-cyano-7-deazaguanine synthase [Leptolyngbya sp. 7M]|uniref:7-cyano-7-deazaguanine synthase n=1 Tax=Leptolyngbya sp. 7M TaxID=2812896 RepID=UPI0029392E35|nr:7-cyano-7-deazaguanine synthase [Leptolyngbya sp. 7M]
MNTPKAVVLLSGGLDSATSAAQAIADGYELIALSLHYGQRHDRELIAAKRVAEHLGIKEHFVVDVKCPCDWVLSANWSTSFTRCPYLPCDWSGVAIVS